MIDITNVLPSNREGGKAESGTDERSAVCDNRVLSLSVQMYVDAVSVRQPHGSSSDVQGKSWKNTRYPEGSVTPNCQGENDIEEHIKHRKCC